MGQVKLAKSKNGADDVGQAAARAAAAAGSRQAVGGIMEKLKLPKISFQHTKSLVWS